MCLALTETVKFKESHIMGSAIKEIFLSYSFWQQMFVLALLSAFVLIAATRIVFFAIKHKLKFKKGDTSIDFDNGDKEKKPESPHAVCIHRFDLYLVMERVVEIEYANAKDLFFGIRDAQMSFAQDKLIDLKHTLLDDYCNQITKKRPEENVTSHRDYTDYEVFLEVLIQRLTDKIRQCFIQNGLEDKEDLAFSAYLEEKSNQLYQTTQVFCNQYYTSKNRIVSREALRESYERLRSKFITCFTDCFVNGRAEIIKAKDRIKMRSEEKQTWIQERLGIVIQDTLPFEITKK